MARIIILSFKDNDAADAAVNAILDAEDAHQEGWGDKAATLGLLVAAHSKVEAVIARPTAPCRCKGYGLSGPFKKTSRFGWYVHAAENCNKPTFLIVRNFIKNMIGGHNNLLNEFVDARKKASGESAVPE